MIKSRKQIRKIILKIFPLDATFKIKISIHYIYLKWLRNINQKIKKTNIKLFAQSAWKKMLGPPLIVTINFACFAYQNGLKYSFIYLEKLNLSSLQKRYYLDKIWEKYKKS